MKSVLKVILRDVDIASHNSMYVSKFNKKTKKQWRFIDKGVKNYKEKIQEAIVDAIMSQCDGCFPKLDKNEYIYLNLEFGIDAFFKNGTPRRKDCSNFIKSVEDAVNSALGVDDSYNFSIQSTKFDIVREGIETNLVFIEVFIAKYEELIRRLNYKNYV